jgi:hypothetical protein
VLPDEARAAAWRALWDALIFEAAGDANSAEPENNDPKPDDKAADAA